MVPTASGTAMSMKPGPGWAAVRKKNQNSGTAITSTTSRNSRFEVAFARKITLRSMGTSRMPSMQPCSFSWLNERFRPSSDVNTISAHRRPPDSCSTSVACAVCPSAAP